LPLAVERERFTRFVLGFPRRYLQVTSPVEIVRHFGLVATLGQRPAASSLAREGPLWKLVVVAADRSFLFARIAGTLSLFGANIVSAEAFSNTEGLVLDTLTVADVGGRFEQAQEGRRFQSVLAQVIDGRVDLDSTLGPQIVDVRAAVELEWDDEAHPSATRLLVSGPDALGLLYAISRRLSEAGCNIEVAHIETTGGRIRDTFFLTVADGKLGPEAKRTVEASLAALAPTVSQP
jgi:[protein-PII] uridylyltransferase